MLHGLLDYIYLSQISNLELENIFATLKLVQNQEIQDYNEPLKRDLEMLPDEPQVPTPNDPPWNSGVAFAFWLVSVIFILVIPSLLIIPYILQKNINFSDSEQLKKMTTEDPTAVAIAIGGTFIAHILTLILGWLIVTRVNKYSFFKMLGWNWGGFKYWHAILLLVGVYITILILSSIFGSADNEMLKLLRSSRTAVYMVAFLATFSAPIVEELVYRGVLYSAFQRTFNKTTAVIFVTTVFAAVHFWQYYPDYTSLLSIILLSLVITLIRVKTDNLLPCIVFHTLINGIQSIILLLAPYLPDTLDPTKPVSGFFWLK